jgi:hypothetical protein
MTDVRTWKARQIQIRTLPLPDNGSQFKLRHYEEIANLDLVKLISDLQRERDRLGRAITALLGSAPPQRVKKRVGRPKGKTSTKRKRGGLTPEGRRRLSLAMKKRWAEGKMKGR